MKKFKKKKVEQEVLEQTTCDRCGKFKLEEDWFTKDIMSFSYSFGYGSTHDQDEISFDLCEDCLFEILTDSGVNYRMKL
jgi:hypothetical protein